MRVAARAADERGRDGRRVAPAHGLARVTGGADSGTAGARVERAAAERARRAIRIAAHDLAAGCAQSRYRRGRYRVVRWKGLSDGLPVSLQRWRRGGLSASAGGLAGVDRAGHSTPLKASDGHLRSG